MAYTNTWTTADPTGAVNANQIDEEIRKVRLDLEERMEALVEDMNTDPVVPKGSVSGAKTGKVLYLSPLLFKPDSNGFSYSYDGNGFQLALVGGTSDIRCPLYLPVGVTITKVRVGIHRSSATSFNMQILSHIFDNNDPANVTEDTTLVASASGYATPDSTTVGATSVEIQTGKLYHLALTGFSAPVTVTVFGAEITYDTPDSRYTI